MLKRLTALLVALSLLIPDVIIAAPYSYGTKAFNDQFFRYDAAHQVFVDTAGLSDHICRLMERDARLARNDHTFVHPCAKPRLVPAIVFYMPQQVYAAASGKIVASAMRRTARTLGPLFDGHSTATVEPFDSFDPALFYERWVPPRQKNRYGVRSWTSFLECIVSDSDAVMGADPANVQMFDLARHAYDSEVKQSLEPPTFSATNACWIIARLVSEQRYGGNGPLLSDGRMNVFRVDAFDVVVMWSGPELGWSIGAWKQAGGQFWTRGDRIFVPA